MKSWHKRGKYWQPIKPFWFPREFQQSKQHFQSNKWALLEATFYSNQRIKIDLISLQNLSIKISDEKKHFHFNSIQERFYFFEKLQLFHSKCHHRLIWVKAHTIFTNAIARNIEGIPTEFVTFLSRILNFPRCMQVCYFTPWESLLCEGWKFSLNKWEIYAIFKCNKNDIHLLPRM